MECPIITPMRVEKKPVTGPSMIPAMGSDMKTQLYQTPEYGKGTLTNESQITENAAKTATKETNFESLNLLTRIEPFFCFMPRFYSSFADRTLISYHSGLSRKLSSEAQKNELFL
jgi:hypothetical protein